MVRIIAETAVSHARSVGALVKTGAFGMTVGDTGGNFTYDKYRIVCSMNWAVGAYGLPFASYSIEQ